MGKINPFKFFMFKKHDISKKSMGLNLNSIIKVFPLISVIISLVSLVYISFFLYKNFYQTITHAQTIEILRGQVSIIKIDTELYEKITKNLEKRKNTDFIELSELKNPFQLSEEKSDESKKINP